MSQAHFAKCISDGYPIQFRVPITFGFLTSKNLPVTFLGMPQNELTIEESSRKVESVFVINHLVLITRWFPFDLWSKVTVYSSLWTLTSQLCGITKLYLAPSRKEFPVFSPAKVGTQFTDTKGMKGNASVSLNFNVGWGKSRFQCAANYKDSK